MNAPRYRDEIRGNVAEHVRDCEADMLAELKTNHDVFILSADDTGAWIEYRDYLTETEMKNAFRRAQEEAAR